VCLAGLLAAERVVQVPMRESVYLFFGAGEAAIGRYVYMYMCVYVVVYMNMCVYVYMDMYMYVSVVSPLSHTRTCTWTCIHVSVFCVVSPFSPTCTCTCISVLCMGVWGYGVMGYGVFCRYCIIDGQQNGN